jgi:hypothetical protein
MRAVEATRLWGRGAVCHAFCARGLGLVGCIKESDGVDKWRQAFLTLHFWLSTPKTARIVCYNPRWCKRDDERGPEPCRHPTATTDNISGRGDKMAEIHAVRSSHGSQLFGLDFGDVIQRGLEPMCLATCTRR